MWGSRKREGRNRLIVGGMSRTAPACLETGGMKEEGR